MENTSTTDGDRIIELEDQDQNGDLATLQDLAPLYNSGASRWWMPVAGLSAICCALLLLFLIAGTIVLALIPIYLQRKTVNNINAPSTSFVVNYGTNLANTRSLSVADTSALGTNLMNVYNLRRLSVNGARFVQSPTDSISKKRRTLDSDINYCRMKTGVTGDVFAVALLYEYLPTCNTAACQQKTFSEISTDIESSHSQINVPITFSNGQTVNVDLFFCSFGLFSTDIETSSIAGITTAQLINTIQPTNTGTVAVITSTTQPINAATVVGIAGTTQLMNATTVAVITGTTVPEIQTCNQLTLATWNIGLEEKQADERTPLIIDAILESDADIIGLQEVWGGPQILRTIYQAVRSKYPNFQVVDDNMRDYISADQIPNTVNSPACPAAGIIDFEICFFQNCSTVSGAAQLVCAITLCAAQVVPLYTNPICWACIFDRYISRQDPFGLNYCGAVNLPQLVSTSSGISPNSTDAPWNNTIGLMLLSTAQYPLQKVKSGLFSQWTIFLRGYIVVTTNNGQLIISNSHLATVDNPVPHPPANTFFNNTYSTWSAENLGQITELESIVWSLLQSENSANKSAVMLGDYNMGIASFAHNVSDLSPDSWYYIHDLKDTNGSSRWYDDYTETHNLCTGCIDNYVVAYQYQYIYDHLFTHGSLFSSSELFTKRIFDEFVQIIINNTNVTTSLSDHYGIQLIIIN